MIDNVPITAEQAGRYRRQAMDSIMLNELRTQFEEMTNNLNLSRTQLAKMFDDGRRDYNKECGYPDTSQLTPTHYKNQYDRNPIAARVVQCFPSECWLKPPSVFESQSPDDETEFEIAWDELGRNKMRGPSWYGEEEGSPIWLSLLKLDVLSGIGHFGIMIIGIDDGEKDLSKPVKGFENGFPEEPLTEKRELIYLSCFDETLVEISKWESNENSNRYGKPLMYSVTIGDYSQPADSSGMANRTLSVHWSRVIHAADNYGQPNSSDTTPTFAPPRMRPVYNRCLDADKLYGGGAEGTWKGAFPGLSVESHPSLGADIAFDIESVKEAIERYMNTMQRYLAIEGATVKSLTPQTQDPTNQISGVIDAICVQIAIPKRIFLGSERGELASSEDKGTWRERKLGRQNNYLTPHIIVPFVDRLILFGVLPVPEQYFVVWPSSGEMDDMEKADLAIKRTEALARYVTGGVDVIISPKDFLTRILGLNEEEALSILEGTKEYLDEQNPHTEEEAVPGRDPEPSMEEKVAQQKAMSEASMSPADRLRNKFAPNPTQQPKTKVDIEKGRDK